MLNVGIAWRAFEAKDVEWRKCSATPSSSSIMHPHDLRWCEGYIHHSPPGLDGSVAVHCQRVLRGHRRLYRALPIESTPAASSTQPLLEVLRRKNSSVTRDVDVQRRPEDFHNLARFKDSRPPGIIAVHFARILPRVGCEVAESLGEGCG